MQLTNNSHRTIKRIRTLVGFVVMLSFLLFASDAFASDKPKRIISLTPSITQSLYYLEAQDRLVGCTSYCIAAKPDHKEIVASAVKPNMEKIVSLRPDLVLASGLTTEKDLATLRKLGISVEVFSTPKSFDEICLQFERLGQLIGQTEKAKTIIAESRSKVNSIQSEFAKKKAKSKLFIQIGASPIFAVIPNTFMDDYINYCNGVNVAADLKSGIIGRELVVARNPDYIFVVTMGIVGEEEKGKWGEFSRMQAAQSKHIFIIDSDMACQPTPITFVQTLGLMSKYMQER